MWTSLKVEESRIYGMLATDLQCEFIPKFGGRRDRSHCASASTGEICLSALWAKYNMEKIVDTEKALDNSIILSSRASSQFVL